MDGAQVAVLSNQIFAAQSDSYKKRYFRLLKKRARGTATAEDEAKIYAMSPVSLLAKELNVSRESLDDLLENRAGFNMGDEPEMLNYDDPGEFRDRLTALDEKYDLDRAEYKPYIKALNDITHSDRRSPVHRQLIYDDDLAYQLYDAVADGRVDLDLLNPAHEQEMRLGVDADPREAVQPLYTIFGDLTPSQQARVADFLESDPFSLNDLLRAYGNDLESGVWFENAGTDELDMSEVWAWFREHYE